MVHISTSKAFSSPLNNKTEWNKKTKTFLISYDLESYLLLSKDNMKQIYFII